MKQIILAEDHKVIRDGLKMLLESENEYQVIYQASNGQEVLDGINSGLLPDLILSDISMPEMDGIAMLQLLHQTHPQIPVLMMSMMETKEYVFKSLKAGAKGFLTKSVDSRELFFAISLVLTGRKYIATDIVMSMIDHEINREVIPDLKIKISEFSSREIEILGLIGQGLTNMEMAEKLFISKRTVEGHRQNLIDKTGARNTAVLMRYAYANGIID